MSNTTELDRLNKALDEWAQQQPGVRPPDPTPRRTARIGLWVLTLSLVPMIVVAARELL